MNTQTLGETESVERPHVHLVEQHVYRRSQPVTTRVVGVALSLEDANKEVLKLETLFTTSDGHVRAQKTMGVTVRFGSRRMRLV